MKQAVILAAGEGQRLRPFTVNKPKVMLTIAGKPVLQYVIEALALNGIRNIVIIAGYKKEQIFDYFGAGDRFGIEIVYITQDKQLGTAHALAQAKSTVDNEFLVLPGDNLIEAGTIARFITIKPDAMMVKEVDNPGRYGVVNVEGDSVTGITEKPEKPLSNIVNTGIYSFNNRIFDFIETELGIPDVINIMLSEGHEVNVLKTDGTWLDIVYPWDILALNDYVISRISPDIGGTIEAGVQIKNTVSTGKDTIIRSNSYIVGPVVIGHNCDIGPGVCIMPSTSIGDNVSVAPFSYIENSVINNDVNIGPGSIIQNTVIDEGCIIGGNFSACSGEADVKVGDEYYPVNLGVMLGAHCTLGNNVVANPGTILGNYGRVQAMKLISGKLPDKSKVM